MKYRVWDEVDRWDKHSNTISFVGVEFSYGTINFPYKSQIKTIKESSKIRYIYYGCPATIQGTLYTNLANDTISNSSFYTNSTILETIESLESSWQIVVFWVFWMLLICGCVFVFYYIDNRWLEDGGRKGTRAYGNNDRIHKSDG